MTASSTPGRIRIPYMWWLREATKDAPAEAPEPDGYTPSDTDYIPSGTADMWRTARTRIA
jgi:hypothetical protein